MKPLITWGRNSSYDINMVTPFLPAAGTYTKYLEPFAGSASMFFHLENRGIPTVLNDINEELMNFYEQIKNGNGGDIKAFMDLHPNNKETYYDILHNFCPSTSIQQASQFYYLRKTCHRSMLRFNKLGLFNVAYGNNQTIDYSILTKPEYREILRETTILNCDFANIFRENNNPDYFMFIDPPSDEVFKNDAINPFTPDDHIRLFKCFTENQSKCLMIINDTVFTKELYVDHVIAAYPSAGKNGTKLIVSNSV